MPRSRRSMGPRQKIDTAYLRELPREERLNLLVRSVVECGGTSEEDDSRQYREMLGEMQAANRNRKW